MKVLDYHVQREQFLLEFLGFWKRLGKSKGGSLPTTLQICCPLLKIKPNKLASSLDKLKIFETQTYTRCMQMLNYLEIGLLLIFAALFFFLVGVFLLGISYLTIVVPILFFAVGIGFVVLDYLRSKHKE